MPDAAPAIVADALAWSRGGCDADALRLLRSPYSGVPRDVAAAYATVAERSGGAYGAMARERLSLPEDERRAVRTFVRALDDLRDAAERGADDAAIAERTHALFSGAVPNVAPSPPASGDIVLAQAVDAEPSQPVRARRRHFSASSLNTYAECPRKWYYRYVCAAVEDKGSSASFYGTAFHAALEHFHEAFPHPEPSQEGVLRSRLAEFVAAAFLPFAVAFETKVEFALQLRRAQRTARRYVTWLVERARRAPFTVVGRELSAELAVEGFDFIGYIDRLDRDDATGAIAVVDYKTGSIARSAAEYRDKVRTFRDFQLPFYYWAREAQGDRVTTLALIPLKDATLDVRPVELEVVPVPRDERRRGNDTTGVIAVTDLERARAKMGELCRVLTDGAIRHFAVTDDPAICTYCAYANACNDRPTAAEQRFGR